MALALVVAAVVVAACVVAYLATKRGASALTSIGALLITAGLVLVLHYLT